MSAAPSATWQNLIADPLAVRAIGPSEVGSEARKASVALSKCERLTAATAPSRGQPRVRIGSSLIGAILQQPKSLGLHADNAAPDSAARRRGDDAGDRHAAGNDGEIDGKFITAGQELAGAIKRVDDQETSINAMVLASADSSE